MVTLMKAQVSCWMWRVTFYLQRTWRYILTRPSIRKYTQAITSVWDWKEAGGWEILCTWKWARSHTMAIIQLCSVAQLCLTLFDPMDCSPPGSSVHGIFHTRILEWVAFFLLQGIFPTQRSNRTSPVSLALVGGFFTHWAIKEARN